LQHHTKLAKIVLCEGDFWENPARWGLEQSPQIKNAG